MNTHSGTLERALRIGGGLILMAFEATGSVRVWGYIGIGVAADRRDRKLPRLRHAGHRNLPGLAALKRPAQGPATRQETP